MKNFVFFIFILICAVFQVTFPHFLNIFYVKPDLILASAIISGLTFNTGWALALSVFAGMLKDALSINIFPINTLLFPAWCILVVRVSRKISLDNNFIRIGLMFSVVILNALLIRIINLGLGEFIPMGEFLRIAFLEGLYTASVLPWLLRITQPIFNRNL